MHLCDFGRPNSALECPLPSLSSLLEHSRIRETDSLVISVQIHCPSGPSLPQQPSVYYVPKDLLDGLEASLDNPSMSVLPHLTFSAHVLFRHWGRSFHLFRETPKQ